KKAFQEGSEELADCWNKAAGAFINSQESVAKLWRAAAQAIQVEDRDAIRCWREAAEFHSENYYFSSWKGVESRVQKAIEYRREATNASLEGNVVVACCWEKAVEALIIKESYKQAEGLVDLWKKRIETVLEYQKESAESAHVGNSELAACWAKAATACTEPWYSVEKSWAEVARATQAGNRDEVEYWTKTAEALTKRQHGRSAKKINRYSDYEWKNIVSCIQMAFEYRAESIGASQSGNREAVGYWEKAANACAETQNKSLGNSWAEAAKSTQVGDWDAVACWSKTAEALAQKLVEAEKQNFEKEKIQEELSKAYRTDNKDAIEHWTKVQRSLSDDCLTSRSSTSWEDMKRCVQKAIEYRKNALQTAQAGHLEVADYWNRVIDVLTMTQNTGLADSWTVAACRAQQVVDYRAQSAQATQSGNVEEAHYWLKAVEVLAGTQRWNVSERNAIIVKANAERKRAWEKYDERDPKSPTITQAKEFEEEDRYVEKVSAFWKETAGFMHRSTECQVEAVKATAAKNKVVACHWAQAAEGVKAVVHDLIDFMESDDFGRKNTPHTRKHINILERYDMCSNYYEDSDKDGNIIDLAQRTAENVINYWLKAASERKPQVSERWKKAAQTAGEAVRCWTQAAKVTPRPKTQNSDLMNSYDENDNPWNEAAGSWNNAAEYWEEAAEGKNQSVHRWTKAAEAAEKAAFYWAQGGKALEFITESINSQESDWHNMAYRWDRASSCLASVKEQPKIAQNLETASLYWTNAATAATKEEAIDWTRAAESAEEIIKYKLDATRDTECANNVNASKRNRSQHRASAKDKLAEARRYETIVIEAKNAAEAKRQAYNVQTISATTNVSSSSLSEFNNQSSNLPSTENSIAASPTSCSSSASATLTTDSKATEQEQKSSAKGKKSKKK
ncbi:MAG TPA: hypothetical protein VJK54_02615, partial [Chthoniobacterales bacterium]|nr:hypothetical protein [Chthoniobacterales bacterium]